MSGYELKDLLLRLGITPSSISLGTQRVVQLIFDSQPSFIPVIKKHGGRWSSVLDCWYMPASKTKLVKLAQALAQLTGTCLTNPELEALIRQLELKSYSRRTLSTYRYAFSLFLDYLYPLQVHAASKAQIEDYLLHLAKNKGYSESAIHTHINAIKFYLEQVLQKDKAFYDLPRPRKPMQLPKVLGEKEISRLFKSLPNSKHKAILYTAYSAGLRVSEVVQLQIKHIDSDRMQIFIGCSKGKTAM